MRRRNFVFRTARTFLLVAVAATATPGWSADHRFLWIAPESLDSSTACARSADLAIQTGFSGVVLPALLDGQVTFSSRLLSSALPSPLSASTVAIFRDRGLTIALYFQAFILSGDWKSEGHIARVHPDWLSWDFRGNRLESVIYGKAEVPIPRDGLFFEPGIERVREFLFALYAEGLTLAQPDWVVVDQIRYPILESPPPGLARLDQPYGYHAVTTQGFRSEWKLDPALLVLDASGTQKQLGENSFAQTREGWNEWRRAGIDRFVSGLREMLTRDFPRARLATVGYPDPFFARNTALQDWPGWIRHGWVDAVILPDNKMNGGTLTGLDLLAPDLRERVWISGAVDPLIAQPPVLAERLQTLSQLPGLVLFAGAKLEQPGVGETIRASLTRIASAPTQAGTAPAPELEPGRGENSPLEGIRALYAFKPEDPPFAGMSPNQVAEKLQAMGFNAVFGGSADPAMRRALRLAGIKRFGSLPLFVGAHYWEKHPESQPVASNGRKLRKQGWYAPVCPNQDWLRAEKLASLKNIARDQELDGMWLDFVRYPVFWEEVPPFLADTCFCPTCLSKFSQSTQLRPEGSNPIDQAKWILDKHASEWDRWRADTILEFVEAAGKELKSVAPKALLGAFVIPWRPDDHNNALFRVAGQDVTGLGRLVDVLSPMLYFHELGHSPAWVGERIREIDAQVDAPVLPIVQCFDLPTAIPEGDLESALGQATPAPSRGVILFSQKHLESTGRWEKVRPLLSGS